MADHAMEGYREKMMRKIKSEPLVPIGALATTAALTVAMVKMRKGDSRALNKWLRIRVIAQGLTIAALCAGTFTFATHKPPTPAELAAKAEERHAAGRADFEERMREAEQAEEAEAAFRTPPPPPASALEPATAGTLGEKITQKRKTFADKIPPPPTKEAGSGIGDVPPATTATGTAPSSWYSPSRWFGSSGGSK